MCDHCTGRPTQWHQTVGTREPIETHLHQDSSHMTGTHLVGEWQPGCLRRDLGIRMPCGRARASDDVFNSLQSNPILKLVGVICTRVGVGLVPYNTRSDSRALCSRTCKARPAPPQETSTIMQRFGDRGVDSTLESRARFAISVCVSLA